MQYYITQAGRDLLGEGEGAFDEEANERKTMVARALAAKKFDLKQTRQDRKRGVKSSTTVPDATRVIRRNPK